MVVVYYVMSVFELFAKIFKYGFASLILILAPLDAYPLILAFIFIALYHDVKKITDLKKHPLWEFEKREDPRRYLIKKDY